MAQAGGYQSEESYLTSTDVTPRLHMIKKPFFFLSAQDDPFLGAQCIPIDHCHDSILIGVTKSGSHCAFIEGFPSTRLWFPKPAIEFLKFFTAAQSEIN